MAVKRRKPRKKYTPSVHLSLNVRSLAGSATLEINERSNELRAQGREVFKLGMGQSPFPVPGPVVEALRRNAHQTDYLPVRGLPSLREGIADYMSRSQGVVCEGRDVLVGPGSKELMFILQLAYYGELILPTPCWVSYSPQAQIIGRHVRRLPTHFDEGWRLPAQRLEEWCKRDPDQPRILVLNYPANPSGGTYRVGELKDLAEVARRYRVVLLSDEIYGELHHRGQHVSIARFYPEGTIVSTGLSKWCGAGGWRLGTFIFPRSMGRLLDAMAVVAGETYTSASAPIQHAAVRAFQGGEEIERYLRDCRTILRLLARELASQLRRAGACVAAPSGAFYLFPDFSAHQQALLRKGVRTSEDLSRRLLEDTGVATLPGTAFGCDPKELTIRIAFVDFDGEAALDALRGLPSGAAPPGDFLKAICPGPLKAVTRICEWVSN